MLAYLRKNVYKNFYKETRVKLTLIINNYRRIDGIVVSALYSY